MAKVIKIKPGEDLSSENIYKAIAALDKGETKKYVCGILGIAYNTKRLQTIIDSHLDRLVFEKTQKAKRRGKPVLKPEAASMVESYLVSGSLEAVAKSHYRSTATVKSTLREHGALLKSAKTDYFNPLMLPEQCVTSTLEEGSLVWSSRYNAPAEIVKSYGGAVYKIWVLSTNGQYAFQPIEELGCLKHLEDLGVNILRAVKE